MWQMSNNPWTKIYNSGEMSIDLEPTTFCNARCPQCGRNKEWDKLKLCPWLPMSSITIEEFKEWFPPDIIKKLKNIHMSGTYGDAGMCKDLFKIAEYIMTTSWRCSLSINTNGGIRDEEFWWNIGVLCGNRLRMIFDVDGINQEMHGFYRRGVDLNKVLDNMKIMSYTKANIQSFTVLFKHNQDYLEQIKDMCREHGATHCDHVESDRFKEIDHFEFIDEDGNKQVLEQVTKDEVMAGDRISRRVRDHRHKKIEHEYKSIKCVYAQNKSIKISARGLVTPCCYLGTPLENAPWIRNEKYEQEYYPLKLKIHNGEHEDKLHDLMNEYLDNSDNFTLSNRTFINIINDKWWGELEETWNNLNTAPLACTRVCGDKCG